MIKTERRKDEHRPPETDDPGSQVLALQTQVAREANQPVTPDSAQEDLMELRLDLFRCDKVDDRLSVRIMVKDTSVYGKLGPS